MNASEGVEVPRRVLYLPNRHPRNELASGRGAMRVYLDNCCLNRPFDDQLQTRIRIESEAKLDIQERILVQRLELAWSYILDYENLQNPFEERRVAIDQWRNHAVIDICESAEVLAQANRTAEIGVASKDALHVACAIAARCDFFLTTDDQLLSRLRGQRAIAAMNPVVFVLEVQT